MQPTYDDLLRENAELKAQVATLTALVAELRSRGKRNSQNSSRPPSSDPPWQPRFPPKPPSGRKPGGQPGHEGHPQEFPPSEQMNEHVVVKPPWCRRCRRSLLGNDPSPRRHPVVEIPEPKPYWIEYWLHTLTCPECGETTTAELPPGVPQGPFGPRLQTFASVAAGVYHLSKRTITGFLYDWWKIPISVGAVVNAEQAVSAAVAPAVEEARVYVQQQPAANADETGWGRKPKQWLWVLATAWVTIFMIHGRRNAEAARALLRDFHGILSSDRWKAYLIWAVRRRQLCWAHLIRAFIAFEDLGGEAGAIGKGLRAESRRLFKWWDQVRDGTLSRASLQKYLVPLRKRVRRWLIRGTRCPTREVAAMSRDLLKLFPALWTFARVPGVEPTNNAAERAIRPAVLWRRVSHGSHCEEGNRFVERMLTVTTTLRQQNRSVADFVYEACVAALHGRKAPSLLPSRRLLRAAI